MHFFYDAAGKVASVNYNGQRYAYLYNMQGDVVGIVDSVGTEVVKYTYDAWGRLLSKTGTMASTFGTLNPFRYRGYIYDEETGLYYLRSRYYNPTWGRFVNADSVLTNNLFAYCNNNAILYSDENGTAPDKVLDKLKYPDRERYSILTNKLTVGQFVHYLRQAADEKWTYVYGNSQYGSVDCVGLHKCIYEWYYDTTSFKNLTTIQTPSYKRGEKYNQVIDLIRTGIVDGFDGIYEICYGCGIPVGSAVFVYDPSSKMADDENKGWIHVGYFIGETEKYTYTVIEANPTQRRVTYSNLLDSGFNYWGWLSGIDYRKK